MKQTFILMPFVTTLLIALNPGQIQSASIPDKRGIPACYSSVKLTHYWIPKEGDIDMDNDGNTVVLDGEKTEPLTAVDGSTIAYVSRITYDKFQMEGSGLLATGKLISIGSDKHFFEELNRSVTPYGVGPQGLGLDPWVSVAANDIEIGTILYIEVLDGLKLPNGLRHNGCVRIDDKSWSFDDCHVDFFILQYAVFASVQDTLPEMVTIKKADCKLQRYITPSVDDWAKLA